uniref:Lysine biosynthesis protein LysW n=1 Tax=candidate division CPR3 bacterium TaxID=2268181 RepID=A0A7C4R3F3_UNCC3
MCPECDNLLTVPKSISVGKIIECPTCGTENEVISKNPLKIIPLEEEK